MPFDIRNLHFNFIAINGKRNKNDKSGNPGNTITAKGDILDFYADSLSPLHIRPLRKNPPLPHPRRRWPLPTPCRRDVYGCPLSVCRQL
jgi:hypothetical protein